MRTNFLSNSGVALAKCSLQFVLEGKPGKETPQSWRLEFSEKISVNIFSLPEAEDDTYGPSNRDSEVNLNLTKVKKT